MNRSPFARCLFGLLIFSSLVFAGDKPRTWLVGHVVSYDTKRWTSTGGSTTNGQVDDSGNYHSTTTETNWNHVTYYLILNVGEYTYFASRTLSFRFQHSPSITENADIKYVLEGSHLIVQGESGREFKMDLVKRRKN
jgi:hypothetical protein